MGRDAWYSSRLWPGFPKPARANRRHPRTRVFPLRNFYSMTDFTRRILFTFIILCSFMLPSIAYDNGWGEVEFVDPTYRVPLDPVFLTTSTNITVREGGRAELPCRIQNQGTKRVAWRSVDLDKFLAVGKMIWAPDYNVIVQHVQLEEDLDDWTLVMPSVRKSDTGLYECQLTSVDGHHTFVQLNVVGPPITDPAVSLKGTPYVERGAKINLTCIASGGTQIAEDIDWFKDGNIITNKDYIITKYRSLEKVALVSTLTVDRAAERHAGTYVCRSSHNKLKDIVVQVLMTGRDNRKRDKSEGQHEEESAPIVSRGTDSSNDDDDTSGASTIHTSLSFALISLVCSLWHFV